MKDQCCSFELAKRLKELGVKQESYFDWYSVKGDREKDLYVSDDDAGYGYKLCSAFTVSELGEILPEQIDNGRYWIQSSKSKVNGWRVSYSNDTHDFHSEFSSKESDARAKMRIYLIENKLVKP